MNINRIYADLKTAKNNISPEGNPTNDEYLVDVAAYHTQQAIEKALKYILHNIYGVDETNRQFKTHNISTLILKINMFDSDFQTNHLELVEMSDTLTSWEASTRYGNDIVSTRNEIKDAIDYLEKRLLPEIAVMSKSNDSNDFSFGRNNILNTSQNEEMENTPKSSDDDV